MTFNFFAGFEDNHWTSNGTGHILDFMLFLFALCGRERSLFGVQGRDRGRGLQGFQRGGIQGSKPPDKAHFCKLVLISRVGTPTQSSIAA